MAQNCFLNWLLPTAAAKVFVFQIDEVETKFLSTNSISEFSHSLGRWRHLALQKTGELFRPSRSGSKTELVREFARPLGRRGHRLGEERSEAVFAHQHRQRRSRRAAGRGDVFA